MFAITSATFPFLARSFARPSPSRRSTPCRRLKTSARSAVEPTDANKSSLDAMQVTLVNVSCKEGTEEAFVAASLSNASNSVEEEDNCRFDCLQDVDDPTNFVLVEIYKTPAGPVAHKETPHYNTWRDTVGDHMAKPRTADKYVPIYPWAGLWGTRAATRRQSEAAADSGGGEEGEGEETGGGMATSFLTMGDDAVVAAGESDGNASGGEDSKVITHVHVSVKPGAENVEEFIQCSIANAASSVLEPDNLRFDVLQNASDPTKFLLIEVYATADGPVAHKATLHYNEWREGVEELMAAPRVARRYRAKFPVEPEAWKMTLSEV